jgi:hypothetical protein
MPNLTPTPPPPANVPIPRPVPGVFAVGSDVGADPTVKVYTSAGRLVSQRLAFDPAFRGGVKAVMADVNGDRVPDLIAAAGRGGGPHVRVFDGRTDAELMGFFAYDPGFSGGVNLGAGDFDGDGKAEIVTGAGTGGGSHVRVFGADGGVRMELIAYNPRLPIGVHVAAADLNGDGKAELITGAPAGGGPHVRVFDAAGMDVGGFYAYAPNFTGGVHVAAADLDGDRRAEIVTGAGTGGGPHVRMFDQFGGEKGGFFADVAQATNGVPVGVSTAGSDGKAVILTALGPGGDGGVVAFGTGGRFVFERQVFHHREGLTFGSGSGFAVSYSDTLAAIAAAERAQLEADDYDLDEVLAYFNEDSEEIDNDVADDILDGLDIFGW